MGHDPVVEKVVELEAKESALVVLAKGFEALFGKNFSKVYATGVTLFGLAFLTAFLFVPVPTDNKDIVHTILGFVMGTMLTTAVAWVLGSSKSSVEKTNLLAKKEKEEES